MSNNFDPEESIKAAHTVEELAIVLKRLFDSGFDADEKGRLFIVFVEVARVNGLKIIIRTKEKGHEIPHFHVSGSGIDASFEISTGKHLAGNISPRHVRLVKWWYSQEHSKALLSSAWDKTRPSEDVRP